MMGIGNLLGALFGWVGLCWALLLLLWGVVWLIWTVRRYFERNVVAAQESVMWRRHEGGIQKVCRAAHEDDFDLALLVALNGLRKWSLARNEGRVIDWNYFEESVPTESGRRYFVQTAEEAGLEVSVAIWSSDGVWQDEDGSCPVLGVVAWAEMPGVGISNVEHRTPNKEYRTQKGMSNDEGKGEGA